MRKLLGFVCLLTVFGVAFPVQVDAGEIELIRNTVQLPFGAYIGDIDNNDSDIVWMLGNVGVPAVCMEPFIDPAECDGALNTIVCGLGHLGYYDEGPNAAGPHLIVDQILPCPGTS